MCDIRSVRLNTGEELIFEVVDETPTYLEVSNPLRVVSREGTLMMSPILLSCGNSSVSIFRSSLSMEVTSVSTYAKHEYLRQLSHE